MTSEEISLMRITSDYLYNKGLSDPKANELMDLLQLTANAAAAQNHLDGFYINRLKLTNEEMEDVYKQCVFWHKKDRKKIKPALEILFGNQIQKILLNKFTREYT
jgi:hypothetical protein